jgi:hypothetical protein
MGGLAGCSVLNAHTAAAVVNVQAKLSSSGLARAICMPGHCVGVIADHAAEIQRKQEGLSASPCRHILYP